MEFKQILDYFLNLDAITKLLILSLSYLIIYSFYYIWKNGVDVIIQKFKKGIEDSTKLPKYDYIKIIEHINKSAPSATMGSLNFILYQKILINLVSGCQCI